VIQRSGLPPEDVLRNITVETDKMCQELAQTAQSSLLSYTPNRWKGYLYKAVGTIAQIPGGYGVGGPVGPGEVLPEPKSADRGTITAFLNEHDEFRIGGHVPKHKAWWYLSPEGKEKLKEERMKGKFGGDPQNAPYWLIAEYGSTAGVSSADVGVRAIEYIKRSRIEVAAKEQQLRAALRVTP